MESQFCVWVLILIDKNFSTGEPSEERKRSLF